MNNACPSCGAVYAVTAKDIGRKIKCKKCNSALRVDEGGLVEDGPGSSPPPPARPSTVPAAVVDDDVEDDDAPVVKSKASKNGGRKYAGGGGDFLKNIGGVPTVLFGFGTFLVIWFTFMTPIGEAATNRAAAGVLQLQNQRDTEIKKLLPKGKQEFELSPDERKTYGEKRAKIGEDYTTKMETATQDARESEVSNLRSAYFEKYGQMFGFILVAFGCIGYLRTEQPPVMQYVAGVILASMMFVVFVGAGGCSGAPKLPNLKPSAVGKGGFD